MVYRQISDSEYNDWATGDEMHVAYMIARLDELGFTVPAATIDYYAEHGVAPEGTIGPDYDDALSDALEQVFDEFSLRVGHVTITDGWVSRV